MNNSYNLADRKRIINNDSKIKINVIAHLKNISYLYS